MNHFLTMIKKANFFSPLVFFDSKGMVLLKCGLLCIALLAGVSCANETVLRFHGYIPEQSDIEQVNIGQDNREQVIAKIGSPWVSNLIDDGNLYYFSTAHEKDSFRIGRVVKRDVLIVLLDDQGVVSGFRRLSIKDGRLVDLDRNTSPIPIAQKSLIRQVFGNFGRIGAQDIVESN